MQSVNICVGPVPGGWMVEGPPEIAPLVFRSGGRAEATGVTLAKAITAAGVDAQLSILDRAGALVGTRRFWAEEPAGTASRILEAA